MMRPDVFRASRQIVVPPGRKKCLGEKCAIPKTRGKMIRDRIVVSSEFMASLISELRARKADLATLSAVLEPVFGTSVRVYHRDRSFIDSTLESGMLNPKAKKQRDTIRGESELESGAYFLVALIQESPEDRGEILSAMESGIYRPVVVTVEGGEDRASVASIMVSGVYTLKVVTADDVTGDRVTVSGVLVDGALVQRVFNVPETTDRMSLTNGMDSGIYG